MSRAAILFMTLLTINVLLGIIVLTVARGERRSRALQLWGWGLLVYAFSQLFFVAPDLMPRAVRLVVGNGLISASAMLTALGVYRYTPLRVDMRLVYAGLALTVLTVAATQVLDLNVIVNIAAPTAYAVLLYSVAVLMLVWRPPVAAKAAARFLAFAMFGTLVMWTVRLVAIWMSLEGTQDTGLADLTQAMFVIAQIISVVASTLALVWIEVRQMQAELRHAASTDQLTSVLNRRATRARLDEEIARCKRQEQVLGLVLFDIDHFKEINDNHGHLTGDSVLRRVAQAMEQAKRMEDVLGRIGGEEFLVILPQHDRAATLAAAERLRESVQATGDDAGDSPRVTISGGIALYPKDGEDWDTLFAAADRRMYIAKDTGRNRVEGNLE